jgi:hypothetical protein
MTTQAKRCVGYWAAYYINRDGGWNVACDALGRIIRCDTRRLALSVARYRRRRLRPLRGGNTNLSRTDRLQGRDGPGRPFLVCGISRVSVSNSHLRPDLGRRPVFVVTKPEPMEIRE